MTASHPRATAGLPARTIRSLKARARDLFTIWRHARRASELSKDAPACMGPEALFRAVSRFEEFRPAQLPYEFVRLMQAVDAARPSTAIEVGTASGGTAFLFCRVLSPTARFVTIDLADTPSRRAAVRKFALPGQEVSALCADSHAPETVDRTMALLGSRQVDFLFIDGDHSYEGVSRDFSLFAPPVRPGGMIAFHDIVQDHFTRFGKDSPNRTGGVPRFWAELRSVVKNSDEIVEDRDQDGFGIGLIAPWDPGMLGAWAARVAEQRGQ